MKIRTPDGQCIICDDRGAPIIRALGQTTLHAVRAMRKLIDALHEEQKARKEEPEKPCP